MVRIATRVIVDTGAAANRIGIHARDMEDAGCFGARCAEEAAIHGLVAADEGAS